MAQPIQQTGTQGDEEPKSEKRAHKYTNGHSYDGMWLSKKKHGKGVFTWKTGDIYDGDYV